MNRYTIKAMLLATYVQAGIIQSKFWKRHDIQADSMGMKVVDGITYGTSEEMNQIIKSGWSADGHPADYETWRNVKLVKEVFPEATYKEWFPKANRIYTYESFLRAVAKFPAFCGEFNSAKGLTKEDTCKREISALFAVIDEVSKGLTLTKNESECKSAKLKTDCPRGPLGLDDDNLYGRFSKAFYEEFDATDKLI